MQSSSILQNLLLENVQLQAATKMFSFTQQNYDRGSPAISYPHWGHIFNSPFIFLDKVCPVYHCIQYLAQALSHSRCSVHIYQRKE